MNSFEELGIDRDILKNIADMGFTEPTAIQEKCIKPIIEGKDVIGKSETGSGKTLAFGCGIIQNRIKKGIGAIVLAPTRELAVQVSESLSDYSKQLSLSVVPIYGGVSISNQTNQLRKANIVVATPGRLLDHMQRGSIDLSQVQVIVLDEADRMVDMGFIDDVKKIMSACPKERQTLLFSATMSEEIKKIEKRYMKNPVRMLTEDYVDPSKLFQVYYDVSPVKKFSLLVHLLKGDDDEGLKLVFCNTKREVDFITSNLNYNGIEAIAIHGGYTQAKRTKTMDNFRNQKVKVLVCTDVAARGLDIPGVSHVYNYDLPQDRKDYVHRIGRTARAGEKGKVINILAPKDHDNFSRIMELGIKVEKGETPETSSVNIQRNQPARSRPSTQSRGQRSNPRAPGGRGPSSRTSRGGNQRSPSKPTGRPGERPAKKSNFRGNSKKRDFNRR